MASNKELITSILEFKPDAVTDGLNNAQLAEMLKGLKVQADAAAKALADAAAAAMKEEESKLTEDGKGLTVVAGKAVTTKRGILAGGETVTAQDLSGGMEAFTALFKNGYIA